MADHPKRAFPAITQANHHFWCGGKDGSLHILRCGDCGHWIHPYAARCPACRSTNVAPQTVSGRGTVAGFTVNHQQWYPGVEVPYVIARVRLDSAPNVIMTTNITGCGVDEVGLDDKVRVTFDEQDGIWFPLFEKVA